MATRAFEKLKKCLTTIPIVQPSDWTLPFELMTGALREAIKVILEQRKDRNLNVIHYVSQTLNKTQLNYDMTKKKLLAIIFAFEEFRTYTLGYKTTVYNDYEAIRFLFEKNVQPVPNKMGFVVIRI